jgi:hypothetical protein
MLTTLNHPPSIVVQLDRTGRALDRTGRALDRTGRALDGGPTAGGDGTTRRTPANVPPHCL